MPASPSNEGRNLSPACRVEVFKEKKVDNPKIGALRVWHVPQVPGKPFHVSVETPKEAQRVMNVLADYDLFQHENRIKPDYCNASGLERYEADGGDGDPDWCEWYDEETGDTIDDWVDPESSPTTA